jgi:predicted MFS family arabinose efflux permease
MIALLSARARLLASFASFAFAMATLLGQIEPAVPRRRAGQEIHALRQALAFLSEQPQLRRLLRGYAMLSLASAAILPLEVVLVTHTLHASSASCGLVLALWGIGATLGSALVARLRDSH